MGLLKKSLTFLFFGFFLFGPGLCAGDSPASKFGRGLCNVAVSPGEYVVQTAKLMKDHDPVTAYFGGLAQGTCWMLGRIGIGLYELVTFPVPVPQGYKPVMDPPTVVDSLKSSGVLNID